MQNAAGAILGPFDSWLVLRGTKTLAVRMAQHNANGLALAEFLAAHPKVTQVFYPGLPDHPQHELAQAADARLRRHALVRRRLARRARGRVLNRVRLIALAESLGGVETLISHPATMTHASVPAGARAPRSASPTAWCGSPSGIEDVEDLESDLAQALRRHLTSEVGLSGPSAGPPVLQRAGPAPTRRTRATRPIDLGRLADPIQVHVAAVDHREHEELRHFVRVQLAHALPQRDRPICAVGLDDHLPLGVLLDAPSHR